ncbi:protein kinase [Nonomuraea sp. NPDC050310]|uniref:serine/threonine-protein kinase n=1 Tax=unclassified Nonomuraea TaxID=2593643 RepID=UPI0033C5BD5F
MIQASPVISQLLPDDPESVAGYRLTGRLGAGSQGTVFAARRGDGVLVALKVLGPPLPGDRERFFDEVALAQRVAPFCTAQVLDFGFDGARPYIVSEFVDGPSLQRSVGESGPRSGGALQRLAVNTATALAAIHAAGVVHRDFKPGNVLLSPDGPVVIDFGIARAVDLGRSAVRSQTIGTPAYMAPELFAREVAGPEADLFSWAATMAFAATGRPAFPGTQIPMIMHAIVYGEPDLGPLAGPLRRLLEECLAKDPAKRPTSAAVVERLRSLPAPAWQTQPPATGPDRRRRRTTWAGVAAVLVAAAAGTGYALWPAGQGQGATALSTTSPVVSPVMSPVASAPVSPMPSGTPAVTPGTAKKPPGRRDPAKGTGASTTPTARPKPRSTPQSTPAPTRDDQSSQTGTKPSAQNSPVQKPPVSKPPATKPAEDPPPTTQPQNASGGQVTWDDAHAYCQSQGASSAAGSWYNLACMGSPGMYFVESSAVCRWKYPGTVAAAPTGMNDALTCKPA